MANLSATFDISEFELRNYTNPYLSPDQSEEVALTEERVNGQLDFLAQMLGWSGPNYWGNLAETPNQKRQLLGGTLGVYNSYVIPKIYEIRNWENSLVVDRLQFLEPGRQTQVAKIVLGDDTYSLKGVKVEGDRYVISLGELPQSFYDQIASGVPLRADIPTYRPAPFYRPKIDISGDASFVCAATGDELTFYPSYDGKRQFPYVTKIFFANSVYYFDQPIYFSKDSSLDLSIAPVYDSTREVWSLTIPENIVTTPGITGYLVWANSAASQSDNLRTEVLIQSWVDPSDWGTQKVLNNFRGVWGNKGGDLPFNFVFDALTIHGLNEQVSVTLPRVERTLNFNDIVNHVYYQKVVTSSLAPGNAKVGDLWWNNLTGALAVWLPDTTGCAAWVEIDYRNSPRLPQPPEVTFSDVTQFRVAASTLPKGVIVRIEDSTGLAPSDGVIGVQGLLQGSAAIVMYKTPEGYWNPEGFYYRTVTDFGYDALLLPYEVPVTIFNSTGLDPENGSYEVGNLSFPVAGDYEVILQKFYNNRYWEIFPDSILRYIADSALFGGPLQGQMWWDFVNTGPDLRAAAIFDTYPHPVTAVSIDDPGESLPDGVYSNVDLVSITGTGGKAEVDLVVTGGQVTGVTVSAGKSGDMYSEGDLLGPNPNTFPQLVGSVIKVDATLGQSWVAVNQQLQAGPPAPTLNLGVVKVYSDGKILQPGVSQVTEDYILTYTENAGLGNYLFTYEARTFKGRVQLPAVTISDAITSAYRADITDLVFSGLTYQLSPCVYNAETPLRLWKSQALQVAETVAHLNEDNYINPLIADLNNGPGPENWEKYFIRLPLEYGRNETVWQKVALVCQDFAYWGTSVDPEKMRCPPEDDLPAIYEELFLYDDPIPDYTYVYSEPYLYSNIGYFNSSEVGQYRNAGIFPASDVQFDEFSEAELVDYEPLHNRLAFTDPSSIKAEIERVTDLLVVLAGVPDVAPALDLVSQLEKLNSKVYGDWVGDYVNVNPCVPETGFFVTDVENRGVEPVAAPVWDASIYKFAPTCENDPASYNVDANHYKIGYCYFVADASAAEDAFFDISQEAAWRYPVTQPKTLYLTPR